VTAPRPTTVLGCLSAGRREHMGENAKTLHSARWRMILYFLYSPFLTVARRIHRLVVCDRNHADPLTPISMSVRATRHVVAHWRWCTTAHGKMTIRSALPLVSGREREQHRLATRQFKHHQQPRAPGLRSWCTARRRDFVPCRALVDTLFEIVMHARWSWTSVDDKGNICSILILQVAAAETGRQLLKSSIYYERRRETIMVSFLTTSWTVVGSIILSSGKPQRME
jgi:hypothetical protein